MLQMLGHGAVLWAVRGNAEPLRLPLRPTDWQLVSVLCGMARGTVQYSGARRYVPILDQLRPELVNGILLDTAIRAPRDISPPVDNAVVAEVRHDVGAARRYGAFGHFESTGRV